MADLADTVKEVVIAGSIIVGIGLFFYDQIINGRKFLDEQRRLDYNPPKTKRDCSKKDYNGEY